MAGNSDAGLANQASACILISTLNQNDGNAKEALFWAELATQYASQHFTGSSDPEHFAFASKRLKAAMLHYELSKRIESTRQQIDEYRGRPSQNEHEHTGECGESCKRTDTPRIPSLRDEQDHSQQAANDARDNTSSDTDALSDGPSDPFSSTPSSTPSDAPSGAPYDPCGEPQSHHSTRAGAKLRWEHDPNREGALPVVKVDHEARRRDVMKTLWETEAKLWKALRSTISYLKEERDLLSREYPSVEHVPEAILMTIGDGCGLCACWSCYGDRLEECKKGCHPVSQATMEYYGMKNWQISNDQWYTAEEIFGLLIWTRLVCRCLIH